MNGGCVTRALRAAKYGDIKTIKRLKVTRALHCRDEEGATCVHYAARSGHLEILKFLVVDCKLPADVRSNIGATPAHDASASGALSTLQWLIKHAGVSPNELDDGGATVLHVAARYGRLNILKWLVLRVFKFSIILA